MLMHATVGFLEVDFPVLNDCKPWKHKPQKAGCCANIGFQKKDVVPSNLFMWQVNFQADHENARVMLPVHCSERCSPGPGKGMPAGKGKGMGKGKGLGGGKGKGQAQPARDAQWAAPVPSGNPRCFPMLDFASFSSHGGLRACLPC